MTRAKIAVLSAATIVAALGLCGCADENRAADATTTVPSVSALTTTPAPPPTDPLPAPDALTGVLYRLADVNVPGAEKVGLVEHATAGDAAALDKFGRALADNGFTPLEFDATDLAWSPSEPHNVVATIVVKTPGGDPDGNFRFPMEFTPHDADWQLTRHTADLLLQLGAAAGVPGQPPPTP